MIIYKGVSDDLTHIFYENVSNETIPVIVKVYESYTSGFIFYSELDLEPNVEYFTYIYPAWKNRLVLIYNRNTNELLTPFVIDGIKNLSDVDNFGYIKKLLNLEKDLFKQSGILDVLKEHHFDRQYQDYCDVEEGDIVVDIGFNYGIFSLGALYKGASKIYGLEPNLHVYNLVKNYYPEKDKVKIYNFAASDENKITKFNLGQNTLSSSLYDLVSDYYESYEVQCVNMYDFLIFNLIEKIDFLKIDCEGAEYQIFEIIPDEYFKKIKKIHVEFHFNDGQKVIPIIDKLNRNGFEWKFEYGVNINSELGLIFAKNKNI